MADLRRAETGDSAPRLAPVRAALGDRGADAGDRATTRAAAAFERALLGLSGGIDSALVACLAARALGPENVLGVAMPSRFSSEGSLTDAAALAKNLGIDFNVISIEPMFEAYLGALAPGLRRRARRRHGRQRAEAEAADLAMQNIQARIRGAILMALSNRHGRLLLTTGNKSEIATGYCTLYGDMAGGLAVISDVPEDAGLPPGARDQPRARR